MAGAGMKPELILHIGLPKTGTTSIQHTLAAHRELLLEQGILYPVSPGKVAHELLPASILGSNLTIKHFHPTIWEGMTPTVRLELFRREFDQELRDRPAHVDKVLMSAEHCGEFLKSRALICDLAAFLQARFGHCKIVAYIRRQDSLAASVYSERLRVGDLASPSEPLRDLPSAWGYNFDLLFDAWASAFGEQAIQVRVYERESLRNGDVVDDFLVTCGIDLTPPANHSARHCNISMGYAGQQLMQLTARRLIARHGQIDPNSRLWRRMGSVFSSVLAGPGWRPTRSETEALMSHFEAGNERLRRRFLPDREVLFLDPADAPPDEPVALDAPALLEAAIDALIFEVDFESSGQARYSTQIALLQRRLQNYVEVKKQLQMAVWFDPDFVTARVALAEEFLREGAIEAAREQAQIAHRLAPDVDLTRQLLVRVARAERNHAAAAPHTP
jgi:tetratricopeptide (TPR) repeat protein